VLLCLKTTVRHTILDIITSWLQAIIARFNFLVSPNPTPHLHPPPHTLLPLYSTTSLLPHTPPLSHTHTPPSHTHTPPPSHTNTMPLNPPSHSNATLLPYTHTLPHSHTHTLPHSHTHTLPHSHPSSLTHPHSSPPTCTETERDDDDTTVCGTNGRNYRSLCLLLQDTGNVQVAYAGRCNRTECTGGMVSHQHCTSQGDMCAYIALQGGRGSVNSSHNAVCSDKIHVYEFVILSLALQVCGSDGVTYNSTCELRSRSANARVDYKGPCFCPTSPETPEENYCTAVRAVAGKCHFNETNCEYRVQPLDGCCPICGE